MTVLSSETVHASSVSINGRAVLISGRPGSGKSDLSLRLIDRGATLVSDDYTIVTRLKSGLVASAPETIRGRIEVRGVGLVEMPHDNSVPVAVMIVVDEPVPRLPDSGQTRIVAGMAIPIFALSAFEASAPIKVERIVALLAAK